MLQEWHRIFLPFKLRIGVRVSVIDGTGSLKLKFKIKQYGYE